MGVNIGKVIKQIALTNVLRYHTCRKTKIKVVQPDPEDRTVATGILRS